MIFWLAVVVGGLMAWNAVQIGFYSTWILFFHLLLAVYMAIFLTPVFVTDITEATATSWGFAMTMMCITIATLSIGYGIGYVCLSGKFHVEFPKTFDTLIAGFVGFLTGFLVLGFMAFVLSLSPLSQVAFCKTIGLDAPAQTTTTAYLGWWCDWMHLLVGAGVPRSSDEAIRILLAKATAPAPVAKATPPAPPPAPAPAAVPNAAPVAAVAPPAPKPADVTPAVEPPAPAPVPPVDEHRRPDESLEEELARRRVVVNSPEDVAAAITSPHVKIIEFADAVTVDKLDPKQTELLQRWVSEGGVVWANNDALTLFGIKYTKLVWWGGALDCTAPEGKGDCPPLGEAPGGPSRRAPTEGWSGTVPLSLGTCAKVVLKDAGGKAHALSAKGAMPLLGLEKDIPFEDKAGTACWSLVPYGKGWVSDPKQVDTMQYDGGQFWPNFCRFCLGRELVDAPAAKKPVVTNSVANAEKPTPPATPKGDLSGVWQSSGGAKFRIYDEGQAVTIDWVSGDTLQSLTGTLIRHDDDPASTVLVGKVNAVFAVDAPKGYAIDMTATTSDSNSMRVRCADWPVWNSNGKYLGPRPRTDTWTRSDK